MPNVIKACIDRIISNANGLRETLCKSQHLSIKVHDIYEKIDYSFYPKLDQKLRSSLPPT